MESTGIFTRFFTTFATLTVVLAARDAPPIMIPGQGTVMGTYLKMIRTQNVKAYLGIPYAQAPRFAPPVIGGTEWKGVRNATKFGPDCWQNPKQQLKKHSELFLNLLKESHPVDESSKKFDEECLNLNIFIPDGKLFYSYSNRYIQNRYEVTVSLLPSSSTLWMGFQLIGKVGSNRR